MDLSELFSVFLALCQNASEVPPGGLGGWEGGLGGLGSSITIMYQRSWFLNVPKQFSAKLTFHEETRKKIFFIPALYFRWRRWLFLWDIFHCHQITFLTSPPQDFLKISLCFIFQVETVAFPLRRLSLSSNYIFDITTARLSENKPLQSLAKWKCEIIRVNLSMIWCIFKCTTDPSINFFSWS